MAVALVQSDERCGRPRELARCRTRRVESAWPSTTIVVGVFAASSSRPCWIHSASICSASSCASLWSRSDSTCCGATPGMLSLGQSVFFGLGAYAVRHVPEAGVRHGTLPDFMNWSGLDAPARVLDAVQQSRGRAARGHAGARRGRRRPGLSSESQPRQRRVYRDHHPGAGVHRDDPVHRPAAIHWWHQRADKLRHDLRRAAAGSRRPGATCTGSRCWSWRQHCC